MRQDRVDWLAAAGGGIAALLIAMALGPLRDWMGNTNVALILLAVVAAAAAAGGRIAGVVTAIVAGLSFNFFHTQPYLSLDIDSREDLITTLLLVVIGLVVGELAQFFEGERRRGRVHHAELQRLNEVSKLVLGGASAQEVVEAVRAALVAELELRDARFEPGEQDGSRAVLGTDGLLGSSGVLVARRTGFEVPSGGLDLPVRYKGTSLGHFVLEPRLGGTVDFDQQVIAVLLAGQAATALTNESRR
jgi:Domain of unknown function (DUF4118)